MRSLTRQEKVNVASAIAVALAILFVLITYTVGPGRSDGTDSCREATEHAEKLLVLQEQLDQERAENEGNPYASTWVAGDLWWEIQEEQTRFRVDARKCLS